MSSQAQHYQLNTIEPCIADARSLVQRLRADLLRKRKRSRSKQPEAMPEAPAGAEKLQPGIM